LAIDFDSLFGNHVQFGSFIEHSDYLATTSHYLRYRINPHDPSVPTWFEDLFGEIEL
jgi:hypothetical protein